MISSGMLLYAQFARYLCSARSSCVLRDTSRPGGSSENGWSAVPGEGGSVPEATPRDRDDLVPAFFHEPLALCPRRILLATTSQLSGK